MISATEIRPGMIIIHNGELHRAHSVLHKTPGNLRGFVQAKLRNLKSGAMNEHRFRSEDKVEKASLDTHQMQYLYSDSEGHHFMNQETFDQIRLDDEVVGESMKYLLPETVIEIDFYDGNPVSVELPTTVNLKIVEVEPGMKGATASASYKPAKLETGLDGAGAAVRRGGNGRQDRHARQLLPGASELSLLLAAALAGALGAAGEVSAASSEPPVLVAVASPDSSAPALAGTGAAPSAACPVRDPETGACFPSADAADLAWLKRPVDPGGAPRRGRGGPRRGSRGRRRRARRPRPPRSSRRRSSRSGGTSPGPSRVSSCGRRTAGPRRCPRKRSPALLASDFPIPLEAFDRAKFRDTFFAKRGRQKKHHAIDLPAPRGTPVLAVTDGVIERLGRDRKGGKVVYLRDTTGRYTFFYAHLAKHEKGLRPGDHVVKGQRLGDVGATGHVIGGPHLHFAIFRDEDDATGGRALVVNPYLVFSPLLTPH